MPHRFNQARTHRLVVIMGLACTLFLAQAVVGCSAKKTTQTTKVVEKKQQVDKYGADQTPLNPERPIRGRIVSLNDARKLSLIPIAEPAYLPDGAKLAQVRIDTGTVEDPTARVHLIYSGEDIKAPVHKGKLWDGTRVAYDGGTSFSDIAKLNDAVLVLFELTPRQPMQITGNRVLINGWSASYFQAKESLSRLEWWSQGISYHVFSKQPKDKLVKIAQSIPMPATMVPAQHGEIPLIGKEMKLGAARKHPLFRVLRPDEPRLTPDKSSLKSLIASYSPEEKIATLFLVYSTKKLPVNAKKIKMSDGSSIAVSGGISLQDIKDLPGGMIVVFRTEQRPPATAPGIPAVVNRKKAYFNESHKPNEIARPLPSEIRWHEKGTAVSVFAYLHRSLLVQLGSSLPKVRDEL